MITSRHIQKVIWAAVLTAVLVLGILAAFSNQLSSGISLSYEQKLFDTDQVMTVNILIDEDEWDDLLETAIAHIARHDLLSVHGMMIAEHPVDKTLPTLSAPYRMGRTYRYGKIAVTIYHRDGDGEAEV